MNKVLLALLLLASSTAHAALSSFYESSSLGYTPLNQAGDTALGAMGFTPSSDAVPITCTGASGGTVDLQDWKQNGGSTVAKVDKDGKVTAAQVVDSGLTASTVPYADASKILTSSAVTPTELGYVHSVTSAIQTQFSLKAPLAGPTFSGTITTPLTASRAMVTGSSSELAASAVTATELGYVAGVSSSIQTQLGLKAALASPALTGTPLINGGKASDVGFYRTCTITSAAAGTAVHCLAAADVGAAQKAYVTYWHAKVNGSTVWATTTSCSIKDTNGTPVDFVDIAASSLTANALVQAATAGVTSNSAFVLGTGGTTAKGLDVICDQNGTGSDLVLVIAGVLK